MSKGAFKMSRTGPGKKQYLNYNWCKICEIKYPKNIIRCNKCGQLIRTTPENKKRWRLYATSC